MGVLKDNNNVWFTRSHEILSELALYLSCLRSNYYCKSWREEAKEPGENSTLDKLGTVCYTPKFWKFDRIKLNKMGEKRSTYGCGGKCRKMLFENIDGRKTRGRRRHTWVGNFEISLE